MIGICVVKATKQIREMLGGGYMDDETLATARLNALKQNAVNAGYAESDIEVKWVTEAEYEAAKLADPVEQASKIEREEQQAIDTLIQVKIKEQAIDALKKEGRLDNNGKLTAGGKVKK